MGKIIFFLYAGKSIQHVPIKPVEKAKTHAILVITWLESSNMFVNYLKTFLR